MDLGLRTEQENEDSEEGVMSPIPTVGFDRETISPTAHLVLCVFP